MSERDYIRQVLDQHPNSLLTGTHVVLKSGRHSNFYFDKRVPLRDPKTCDALGNAIANILDEEVGEVFEAVVATAYGAIALAYQVALHLQVNGHENIKFFIAEKAAEGGFTFNGSDAKMLAGMRVLVVEDVNTTASSTLEVLDALDAVGADTIAVTTLVDRSGERASHELQERNVMFVPILDMEASDWPPDDCKLCQDNVPVNTDVGRGKQFLANKV